MISTEPSRALESLFLSTSRDTIPSPVPAFGVTLNQSCSPTTFQSTLELTCKALEPPNAGNLNSVSPISRYGAFWMTFTFLDCPSELVNVRTALRSEPVLFSVTVKLC